MNFFENLFLLIEFLFNLIRDVTVVEITNFTDRLAIVFRICVKKFQPLLGCPAFVLRQAVVVVRNLEHALFHSNQNFLIGIHNFLSAILGLNVNLLLPAQWATGNAELGSAPFDKAMLVELMATAECDKFSFHEVVKANGAFCLLLLEFNLLI